MPIMIRTQEIKTAVRDRFGSMTAFAQASGWSLPEVSRLVNGKRPWTFRILDRMCHLLQRQPGELIHWEPDPN